VRISPNFTTILLVYFQSELYALTNNMQFSGICYRLAKLFHSGGLRGGGGRGRGKEEKEEEVEEEKKR
jgi:hypothetical protein